MNRTLAAIGVALVSLAACGGGEPEATLQNAPTTTTGPTTTAQPTTTTTAAPTTVTRDTPLTFAGLGPVRFGQTIAEVERSSDVKFAPPGIDPLNGEGDCTYRTIEDAPVGVSVMLTGDRITRIDISQNSAVSTLSGLNIGDSEATVKELYPAAKRIPPPYEFAYTQYVYEGTGTDIGRALLIQLDKGSVVTFRTGFNHEVGFEEGCL